jgi:hypothetical protein
MELLMEKTYEERKVHAIESWFDVNVSWQHMIRCTK